jgi:hypothetical protein
MQIGTSQIDITPAEGAELSGFAARTQPSIGTLDSLSARCIYLVQGDERLLWIHADLIGFERSFVESFRKWISRNLGLPGECVMLSATHTHSGPATIHLFGAGRYDNDYVLWLESQLREVTQEAIASVEPVDVVAAWGSCDLAVDRRGKASAHTDPRVGAIGWRRLDGTFPAVVTNYAMHGVALGPKNRLISADVPGRVAGNLSARLPGEPVVLATNGACGNLNPPRENVSEDQIGAWGEQIASAVAEPLASAQPVASPALRVQVEAVSLPLEALSADQIDDRAEWALKDADGIAEWGDMYRRAVEHWRRTMTARLEQGELETTPPIELMAVRVGDRALVGVGAEAFSEFTVQVSSRVRPDVLVVGYTNGLAGYLATETAYEEGGYEVDQAHFFYTSLRPRKGALETLAARAAGLISDLWPPD